MRFTFFGLLLLVLINVLPAHSVSSPVWVEVDLPPPAVLTQAEEAIQHWSKEDLACLTKMVYGEAGNQSYAGKVAVAAVAVNRTKAGRWGRTLCQTIKQKGQFAGYWANRNSQANRLERLAWAEAEQAALDVTLHYELLPAQFQEALYFHEKSVPQFTWAKMEGRIGDHVFYGA